MSLIVVAVTGWVVAATFIVLFVAAATRKGSRYEEARNRERALAGLSRLHLHHGVGQHQRPGKERRHA